MRSILVEKNVPEMIEDSDRAKRKKQRVHDSELSANESATDQKDSFLSYSSHSTPLNSQPATKINCQPLSVESVSNRKRKLSEEDENYCYFKSDIDSILKCPVCHKTFDHAERLPKMMCDRLTVCLKCTNTNARINCKFCDQIHGQSDRTNSTILALITIKPTKINSEELVFQSKSQKLITEIIHLSDSIGKVNSSLKLKLEQLSTEVKNMKNKSDLKQVLSQVTKIKETLGKINENLSQVDPVFSSKEVVVDNVVPVNDTSPMLTVYFDFDSLQDRKWFYPISRKIFYTMESETKQDCIEIKLKITNNKQEIITQKLVKNFAFKSTMVAFDSKNFVLILDSNERQIFCIYEIGGSFQNLKFVNADKRIIYVNQSEVMIFVEKKKCITVLDHDFNRKVVFGQVENEKGDFYLPKTGFEVVFANEQNLVIRDLKKNCLTVMERTSGKYVHSFFIESVYADKILVDKMNRLVMVHKSFDKVDFMDLNLKQMKRINLELQSEISDYFITFDNHLAFVNFDKCFIIFVKL